MLSAASDILDKAVKLLEKASLCDRCLGRFFAGLGFALTNKARGESIKTMLLLAASASLREGDDKGAEGLLRLLARTGFKPANELLIKVGGTPVDAVPCELCLGMFDSALEAMVSGALSSLSNYEFGSFLVGCKVPGSIIEREDSLRSAVGIEWGESIKREVNREAGLSIASRTGKTPDFQRPDLLVVLNFHKMSVEVKPFPIFVRGRYRKLVRGVPQSRWFCPQCRGKGCSACNWTGKRYQVSVEELVTQPLMEAFGAAKAKFHGAGREDIDVRVLGPGRPFVVELIEPRKRFVNLEQLQGEVNRRCQGVIEVADLSYADKSLIGMLKLSARVKRKAYRVLVESEEAISRERLEAAAAALSNVTVKQRTPTRVLHRRADKLRLKKVHEVKLTRVEDGVFEVVVKCQGGLYVKELVHGDGGRTTPSLQELLGVKLKVLELDVVDVETP
ncbi:MAG: tRNA pseudouridine(54/55) synthase Pus10 [Candidatus Nezhaarchaeota archaeon]|nr:tRNA pseudouridine(54/55) synthase Pus10 [Candidatus Nezhaarchaeota archaeon]